MRAEAIDRNRAMREIELLMSQKFRGRSSEAADIYRTFEEEVDRIICVNFAVEDMQELFLPLYLRALSHEAHLALLICLSMDMPVDCLYNMSKVTGNAAFSRVIKISAAGANAKAYIGLYSKNAGCLLDQDAMVKTFWR